MHPTTQDHAATADRLLRTKPELRPRRTGHQLEEIRVGGDIYGVARTLADPTGLVWRLLGLLDGSRTAGEAARTLSASSEVGVTDARGLVDQLLEAGIVEDVPVDPTFGRGGYGERHASGRSLLAWMDLAGQPSYWGVHEQLRVAHVLLVGVGGTGSHAALGLAGAGVGRLTLVDADTVESSNLARQVLYDPRDVGEPKVDAARRRLQARCPDTEVRALRQRVTGADDLVSLLDGVDCLVLAADEPQEVRTWADRACATTRTPWAAGGYQGPQTSTWVFRPGTGPCLGCLQDRQDRVVAAMPPREDLPHHRRPEANPVSYVTAALSGAHLANAALSLLVGVPGIPVNRQYFTSVVRPDHAFSIGLDTDDPRCTNCQERAA